MTQSHSPILPKYVTFLTFSRTLSPLIRCYIFCFIPLFSRLWVHANNTLQISSVTEDDAGVYSCHVNNTRGAATARRPLLVHAPPRIVGIEAGVVPPAPPYGVEETPTIEPRLERRELATDRRQVVLGEWGRGGVGARGWRWETRIR